MLQFSTQRSCVSQERQKQKAKTSDYILILYFLSGIFAGQCLFNARLKHSRCNLAFEALYDIVFGMPYQHISFIVLGRLLPWNPKF